MLTPFPGWCNPRLECYSCAGNTHRRDSCPGKTNSILIAFRTNEKGGASRKGGQTRGVNDTNVHPRGRATKKRSESTHMASLCRAPRIPVWPVYRIQVCALTFRPPTSALASACLITTLILAYCPHRRKTTASSIEPILRGSHDSHVVRPLHMQYLPSTYTAGVGNWQGPNLKMNLFCR